MNNIKNKFLLSFILFLVLSSGSFALAAQPTDGGLLPYDWYSDSGKIGYFPHNLNSNTILKLRSEKSSNCVMPESTFTQVIPYGIQRWSPSLSLTIYTTNLNDYHIFATCISGAEAQQMGIPIRNTAGYSSWDFSEIVYYVKTKTGDIKYVEKIYKSKIYLIWTVDTMFFGIDKWKSISTHEFGHALGYMGHDSGANINNKAIMAYDVITFYDQWKLTSPTSRDITHILNSYTKFYS